jgi:sulfite reductase (ferredoxin)
MVDDHALSGLADDWEPQQPQGEDLFMIRCNIPGGYLTAEQYLLLDAVATRYMHGSLRITTRYNLQLHGALARSCRDTVERLAVVLKPLLGSCAAVGRPIMTCPAPAPEPTHVAVHAIARQLSDRLFGPAMGAYEVWFGGEKIAESRSTALAANLGAMDVRPSIHFKIGIAAPGDNCIDVFTHDLGLTPVVQGDALCGFNVLVGGSMGMAPHKPDAFPRLAEPLVFVTALQLPALVNQIIDLEGKAAAYAGRERGRFKHLISAWGLERLRRELEGRLGCRLQDPVAIPPAALNLHLGWQSQGDGRWYLGLSIENGRIRDQGELRLRTGLRDIVTRFRPGVRLTPNQDLLLTGVSDGHRGEIETSLRAHRIPWPDDLSTVRRYAMACPARPSCGHAVAEAERVLPTLIDQLEAIIAQLGLENECLSIRMNGCAFGCTRPYVADLAFVGDGADCYNVFLGGRSDGSRVNWLFREQVPGDALVKTVQPLLVFFKDVRLPGERFGDFCTRMGRAVLRRLTSMNSDEDSSRC